MATVQAFISTMTSTLDSKGRVCIPAPYRDVLTAQNTEGVYICPHFAEPCLIGFGEPVLQQFHATVAAQDPFFAKDQDDRAFAVLGMTSLLPRDENGRVRLPEEMIAHAGLKDRVTFIGLGTRFQIWSADRFAAIREERLQRAVASRDNSGNNNGGGVA
ncbi:MAG TPA: hypothetical protein VFI93_12615 [Rhizomicrobium sp.]|jgi:MraZ protein|nr:hypothetical protein [Rhizomicrobium sp.]